MVDYGWINASLVKIMVEYDWMNATLVKLMAEYGGVNAELYLGVDMLTLTRESGPGQTRESVSTIKGLVRLATGLIQARSVMERSIYV